MYMHYIINVFFVSAKTNATRIISSPILKSSYKKFKETSHFRFTHFLLLVLFIYAFAF